MDPLINYDELEKHIKNIELILDKDGLTYTEKKLVLGQVISRLNTKIKNQQATDMIGNISLGGLFKKVRSQIGKDVEKE